LPKIDHWSALGEGGFRFSKQQQSRRKRRNFAKALAANASYSLGRRGGHVAQVHNANCDFTRCASVALWREHTPAMGARI
jgi:hypothetical protein